MSVKKLDSKIVWRYLERFQSDVIDLELPFTKDIDFDLIVVIPSKNEQNIKDTLLSLAKCKTHATFGVLVILNASTEDDPLIKSCNVQTSKTIDELEVALDYPVFYVLENDIDPKKAGVGNARKYGMDLALKQFASIEKNGIIVNLDADCLVSENYIEEIQKAFVNREDLLATLYFEHLKGNTEKQSRKIELYELHLRYYVNGLKLASYPFHMHTVGSCIAVSASAYSKHGGMNRRKAGEDFYFIHKLATQIPHVLINGAIVYPSARNSDRVPFGTGASMIKMDSEIPEFYTYAPKTFDHLSKLLSDFKSESFFDNAIVTEDISRQFLEMKNFEQEYKRIKRNTASKRSFYKKLFQWFDGFKAMKYIHFLTEQKYPKIEVESAARQLLESYEIKTEDDVLNTYRRIDKYGEEIGKVIADNEF